MTHPEDAMTRERARIGCAFCRAVIANPCLSPIPALDCKAKAALEASIPTTAALASAKQEPAPSAEVGEVAKECEVIEILELFGGLVDTDNGYRDEPDDCVVRSAGTLGRDYTFITVGDCRRAQRVAAALRRHAGDGGVPEGWKLVPVDLTMDMRAAAVNTTLPGIGEGPLYEKMWRALLAAAPAARAKSSEKGGADV